MRCTQIAIASQQRLLRQHQSCSTTRDLMHQEATEANHREKASSPTPTQEITKRVHSEMVGCV